MSQIYYDATYTICAKNNNKIDHMGFGILICELMLRKNAMKKC
jgi:hypothetical protein